MSLRTFSDALVRWALRRRLVRAVLHYSDHRGGLLAAAITFRMLFAVFAAVFLGFSFISNWLWTRGDFWEVLIETVDNVVPGLIAMDGSALIDVTALPDIVSSFTAPVLAVLVLLWALLGGVANVRRSIRSLAGTRHRRSNALLTRAFELFFALSIGLLIVASAVLSFLGSAFIDTALAWLGASGGGAVELLTRIGAALITFVLDAVIIVWLFWLFSGTKVPLGVMLPGALLGAVGLVVLQQASGLFLGGVDNNPLLATFSSLIALLLWFNFSAQVTLIACAFIVMTAEENDHRVAGFYDAVTMKERALRAAQRDVFVAQEALDIARAAVRAERAKS